MSKSTTAPVLVSAARIREAFQAGLFTAPDAALPSLIGSKGDGNVRGRLNPLAVEAFEAQVKGEQYAGEKQGGLGVASKTVEVPMFSPKTGRPVKSRTLTIGEVRTLAGVEGRKGRLSAAHIAAAAKALGSGDPKPVTVKAPAKTKTVKAAAAVKVPEVTTTEA
jgi:hypothetical protein